MRTAAVATTLLLCATLLRGQATTTSITGQVTVSGEAMPGVTITVSSPSLQSVRTVVTDESGAYHIAFLPAGEYTVRAEVSGMSTATKVVSLNVAQTARLDFDFNPVTTPITGTIRGSVTANGNPVSAASVTITGVDGNEIRVHTNDKGTFQQSSLTPGSYNVVVTAPKMAKAGKTVAVQKRSTTQADFALVPEKK